MVTATHTNGWRRRHLLLAVAALSAPRPGLARAVYTPHELMRQYARDVTLRLHVPADDARLYGSIVEMQLCNRGRTLLEPQYLLVIDRNPWVQAALLYWRLLPGSYELVGASPVSAGANPFDRARPVQDLFERVDARAGRGRQRVYDFRAPGGEPIDSGSALLRLQMRAADARAERRLGSPCPDGCILLPASLISFLDEYGVLDDGAMASAQRHLLPYRGRHLLIVDSERDERPEWSPAPEGLPIRPPPIGSGPLL
jgi:hypothetical protein